MVKPIAVVASATWAAGRRRPMATTNASSAASATATAPKLTRASARNASPYPRRKRPLHSARLK